MRVPIDLPGSMVVIIVTLRDQLEEPLFDIPVKPLFRVVNEDAGRYVHGGNQYHTLFDAAFLKHPIYFSGNINKFALLFRVESEVLGQGFHVEVFLRKKVIGL